LGNISCLCCISSDKALHLIKTWNKYILISQRVNMILDVFIIDKFYWCKESNLNKWNIYKVCFEYNKTKNKQPKILLNIYIKRSTYGSKGIKYL